VLITDKLRKDFDSIEYLFTEVLRQTDGRYKKDLASVMGTLKVMSGKLKTETDLRKRLEHFKARGFKVKKYIDATYDDFTKAESVINGGIRILDELTKLGQEYESIRSNVSPETRQRFEAIMKDPEALPEVKSLWAKIKVRNG